METLTIVMDLEFTQKERLNIQILNYLFSYLNYIGIEATYVHYLPFIQLNKSNMN